MSQAEDISQPEGSSRTSVISSTAVPTSDNARQRRKIAELEEKLQMLESGHAVKQRETNYFMSQGRAIRRIIALFDSVEDMICENDRRCELEGASDDDNVTLASFDTSQDCLQSGYVILNSTFPWFHSKASDMEHSEYMHMLKRLRQGADSARGDDTSKLKTLVPDWVNREWRPDPPVDPEDKYCRGFAHDMCGKLLCPTELDWNDPIVRAGIRDREDGHVVTEMSWPVFLYAGYTADQNNLEEGLFKSKLLVQAYKAIFTSPSSAKDVSGDGDGANIIENNRRAKRDPSGKKVKTHLRFALSSVTSWRSIDGDFDYSQFWYNIVDFFEHPPGRIARRNVDRLLTWWTRKVFGTSHRAELSEAAMGKMSVNTLAMQRARLDDAQFDSE
ncbi:hypothetical protein EDD22DRAFT_780969 [Suillus occidentalis]|nr:hypothetical protein EDD22DRAFT_780969 [Suillus occidentalis]